MNFINRDRIILAFFLAMMIAAVVLGFLGFWTQAIFLGVATIAGVETWMMFHVIEKHDAE